MCSRWESLGFLGVCLTLLAHDSRRGGALELATFVKGTRWCTKLIILAWGRGGGGSCHGGGRCGRSLVRFCSMC